MAQVGFNADQQADAKQEQLAYDALIEAISRLSGPAENPQNGQPFTLPDFPPGVAPPRDGMAMDDAFGQGQLEDRIYTSDLRRACETAHIIGRALSVPISRQINLRPWDLGTFAGQSTKDAMPRIARYVRDMPDKPVPQGESFNDFKQRALSGLRDILDHSAAEKIAIVTHYRIERLIKAWIAAGAPSDMRIDIPVFLAKGENTGEAEIITIPAQFRPGGIPWKIGGSTPGLIRNESP
jgi:Histidine phosphatase superfamily (branch 1)